MEASEVYFDPSGRPTVRLFQDWQRKGASIGLQVRAVCVESGLATKVFRGIWAQAFPTRLPLPLEPIATREGRFTSIMLDIWNG